MDSTGSQGNSDVWRLLGRVGLWAGTGYLLGARGTTLKTLAIVGPVVEEISHLNLEDVLAALQQATTEDKQLGKPLTEEPLSVPQLGFDATRISLPGTTAGTRALSSLQRPQTENDAKWREVIHHPSVVLILGRRGSGKSALGYRLLELFRHKLTPYVVGLPKDARRLVPGWIGVAQSTQDVPSHSISLVDEAYLRHHARDWAKAEGKSISEQLNLSRQRDKSIVFIAQQSRQIDIDIASSSDIMVLKNQGLLQPEFDRPGLRSIIIQARQAFEQIQGERQSWSFVYSQDAGFAGLLENQLPTFWTSELGKAYAHISATAPTRLPSEMTHEEKAERAKELHRNGWSLSRIAEVFGVSKSTIHNWVHDYPYGATLN